jgi:hypothetical protein
MSQELGVRSLGIGGREYYTDAKGPYSIPATLEFHYPTTPNVRAFLLQNNTGGTVTPILKVSDGNESHAQISPGDTEIFTITSGVGSSNGTITLYELF